MNECICSCPVGLTGLQCESNVFSASAPSELPQNTLLVYLNAKPFTQYSSGVIVMQWENVYHTLMGLWF